MVAQVQSADTGVIKSVTDCFVHLTLSDSKALFEDPQGDKKITSVIKEMYEILCE